MKNPATLRRKLQQFLRSIPQHLSALRYRRDGDFRRFITRTLASLPATPPATRGTLLLFAHYDPQGLVDPYVRYYLQALRATGATILFVSGSPNLDPITARAIEPLCAGIYARRTLSLDFGSWHLAWRILHQKGWSLDHFDRLILANDSVYAPLFPIEELLASFTGADMYGAIENQEISPHLQSFFLAWDLNARTRPFLNHFWDNFQYIVPKQKLIEAYEIGLSTAARQAGLSLKPFLSAARIQAVASRQSPPASRASTPQNHSLYLWDILIEHLRFPFLKTVLPRTHQPSHPALAELQGFLQQHTAYPYALIQNNLNRLGCTPTSHLKGTPLKP